MRILRNGGIALIGKGPYESEWEYAEGELKLLRLISEEPEQVPRTEQAMLQRLKATAKSGRRLKSAVILRAELTAPERLMVLAVLNERLQHRSAVCTVCEFRQTLGNAGLGMHVLTQYLNPEGRLFRQKILQQGYEGKTLDQEYSIHPQFLRILEGRTSRMVKRGAATYAGWVHQVFGLMTQEMHRPFCDFAVTDRAALARIVRYPKNRKSWNRFFETCKKHALDSAERQILALLLAGHVHNRGWDFKVETMLEIIGTPSSRYFDRAVLFSKASRLVGGKLVEMGSMWGMPEVSFVGSAEVRLSAQGTAELLPPEILMNGGENDHGNVQTTGLALEDLILPESIRIAVSDIIAFAGNGKKILKDWDLERITYGSGLGALFYGPPGTGKTALAGAIAKALDRPLHVMETHKVLNPYVGETEAGMKQFFSIAEKAGAVLFIDEADSFLQSRDHAVHSWESSFVNTLLRLIERFNGLVILATNHEVKLDKALDRRLQFKIEFPMPYRAARLALWSKMLGSKVPLAADVDLNALASAPLSGGQIKNAVLAACIRATRRSGTDGPVTHQDLLSAAEAERRSSAGRSTPEVGFRAF